MISIQQAASNSIAAFLADKLPDVKVASQWPAPDRVLPAKAISVITAGSRRDTPIERKLLKATNNGATQVDAVWQIAACHQPLQLDVWAQSDFDRDEMIAALDVFLNYGEKGLGVGNYDIGSGVLLNLSDGWESYSSTADFYFGEIDTIDSNTNAGHHNYRGTYRGHVYVMLAIPVTSPRQILINFTQFLNGESDSTTSTISE